MTCQPKGYKGDDLPELICRLLADIEAYGITAISAKGYTINLMHNGKRYGYINENVRSNEGALGYHFAKEQWNKRSSDSCPPDLANNIIPIFCERCNCNANDIFVHKGTGKRNKDRTFLIIKNPEVAKQAVLEMMKCFSKVKATASKGSRRA